MQEIKVFFFYLFVGCVLGAIVGYHMGNQVVAQMRDRAFKNGSGQYVIDAKSGASRFQYGKIEVVTKEAK